MLIASVIIAVAFLGLCLWRRDHALTAFCALLPLYLVRFAVPLPIIGSLPTTLLEVLFAELFIVWYLREGQRPEAWRAWTEWAGPLMLLFAAATIGVAVSGDVRAALGVWRAYFVEPLLLFPLFVDVTSRMRRASRTLAALGACVAVIGVTAIYQKLTGFGISNPNWQAEATRRVTSFYGFPNALALFSAPIMVLMAGWALALLRGEGWAKKARAALPLGAFLLGLLGLVFAVSEGGLVGAAAGSLTLGLLDKRLRAWALGGIIAACIVVMAYAPATTYFANIIGFRDDSSSVRGIIWTDTVQLLRDQPVFGAGLSGYPTGIAPYHKAYWIEIFQYPHNLVLNFWSEVGLLGLAAFIWIVTRFFRMAYGLRRHGGWIVPTACAAMVALLVHGLVDVPYFKNDLAFLFWIIIGVIETYRNGINVEKPKTTKA